ncbi:MAG: DoxX family protein [Reichenbachiella sp.]|uniref:DoxX family protein n=1 Tax=Reichenbachiella sp. TaxID=2184521 RepID=UPI00296667CA|nr:DoxX family protein [Reichenbachiella sp.]MDW3209819.1 DoxX family protein [Reichenbachiella sp.]
MFQTTLQNFRIQLTKAKPMLLWLIGAYLSYKLMINGFRKFDPDGMWTKAFIKWGYPVWFRIFIGVLEILGGLLLLIPRTRHLGGIILAIVMIGALCTRLIFGTTLNDALAIAFNAIVFFYLASDHTKKGLI